jgi:hypothetical protein
LPFNPFTRPPSIPLGGFFIGENHMDESVRQLVGAVFIAIIDAVAPGDDAVYARACSTLKRAVDTGAIVDPYAARAMTTLAATAEA